MSWIASGHDLRHGNRGQRPDRKPPTQTGLFISQGIVQAHGGKLLAESQPGQGSELRCTVPKID
ncbi:hypothetical protein PHLH4_04060 [Pseudomonas sp. St316]|nr:hypothetical protein PHLH4_04060 [Pseudomonas sp. St316]